MDEILGQTMRKPVNFKDFLLKYRQLFKPPFTIPCKDVNVQDVMQLAEDCEKYKTIQECCSTDNLKQPDDPRIAEFFPGSFEISRRAVADVDIKSMNLKSFRMLTKHKQCKKPSAFQRSRESYTLMKHPAPLEGAPHHHNLEPGEEIMVYVRFYRPARATHIGRTLEKPVFSQEFACLGRNFLTELRDKIYCVCNNKTFFDVSEHPDAPLPTKNRDPGFFFITDTFYNDKRNPLNADYSKTIRDWAKTAKGLTHVKFKVAHLEETRFIDLTVSFGFPQLYQHHGNCEHVFVFSNIEVITNPSLQLFHSLSYYPFVLSISRFNSRTCNICGKFNYVFVVEGSNRLLQDPAYLCKQCFTSFHYIDGKKIGEFSAYRLNDELGSSEMDENCELYNSGNEEASEENLNENAYNGDNNSDNSEGIDIIIKEETTCNIDDNSCD